MDDGDALASTTGRLDDALNEAESFAHSEPERGR